MKHDDSSLSKRMSFRLFLEIKKEIGTAILLHKKIISLCKQNLLVNNWN